MSVHLIANPAAGSGRGRQRLDDARAALSAAGDLVVRETRAAGDEGTLVRRSLDEGARAIAVLGGDGTWSHAAAALVDERSHCPMALLAAGTGNDFAKSVAAPATDYVATARLLADGATRRVDVGRLEGRVFLNVAGFGFDAAVLQGLIQRQRVNGKTSSPRAYVWESLRQLLRYRAVTIRSDDEVSPRPRLLFAAANGQTFGGEFLIAPRASVDDGLLDIVSVADAGPVRRARIFLAARNGAHLALAEVEHSQRRSVVVRFAAPPLCDVDGELYQASAAAFEIYCVPRALTIVC